MILTNEILGYLIYISYIIKYLLGITPIDILFFTMNFFYGLMFLLFVIKYQNDKIMFLAHTLFLGISLSIFCNIFLVIYSYLFYFGFSNTILFISLIMSTVYLFKQSYVQPKIPQNWVSQKITDIKHRFSNHINHETIITQIKLQSLYYSYLTLKFIIYRFYEVNNILAKNIFSEKIIKVLYQEYYHIQNQFIKNIIKSYFGIDSLENFFNENKNSFALNNINTNISSGIQMTTNDKSVKNLSQVDDLDDFDSTDVNEVTVDQQENIVEDNHAKLKKKLAQKKSMRSSGVNNVNMNNLPKNVSEIMKRPGMNKMMKKMLKEDNLKKILQQIPNTNLDTSDIKPEQIKEVIRNIKN